MALIEIDGLPINSMVISHGELLPSGKRLHSYWKYHIYSEFSH